MTPVNLACTLARIDAITSRFAVNVPFTPPVPDMTPTLGTAGPGAGARAFGAPATRGAGLFLAASPTDGAPEGSPAPDWAARLPRGGRAWHAQIEEAAQRAGIDPRLLAAVVWAESSFDAEATSHAGAIGLAQLMPATARGLGVDPHDPQQNLLGGARYLREQLDRFGDVELALAAYNAGPNRVAQAGGIPQIAETRAYVPKVLSYYEELRR